MTISYIGYVRVSTKMQADSGLGEEAQIACIKEFVSRKGGGELRIEREVESGRNNSRPILTKALKDAAETGATLVIAKLDRLSRNSAFIGSLMDSKVKFVACDMPDANEFTISILAAVAQHEAKMISTRTKAALEAAKARGAKLGNPRIGELQEAAASARMHSLRLKQAKAVEVVKCMRDNGGEVTVAGVVRLLNSLGVPSARGKRWHVSSVWSMLRREGLI